MNEKNETNQELTETQWRDIIGDTWVDLVNKRFLEIESANDKKEIEKNIKPTSTTTKKVNKI